MKYIWAEQDIICGIFVCKKPNEGDVFVPSNWNAKWMHKIGYQKNEVMVQL